MNISLAFAPRSLAAACAALFAGSVSAQTPAPAPPHPPHPPPHRRLNPTGRSPATSASSASTCSAAFRRPTRSRRSRAASTSATRAASTPAPGRRTSAGSPTAIRTSRRSLEWDFYGGYKWALPADFVCDIGALYYWYPGTLPAGLHEARTPPSSTRRSTGRCCRSSTATASTTNLRRHQFGGSDYIEGNINWDIVEKVNDVIGKVTLIGHVGYQDSVPQINNG